MNSKLTFKMAVIAVATTAFALSSTAHAQVGFVNQNQSNGGNQVLGMFRFRGLLFQQDKAAG